MLGWLYAHFTLISRRTQMAAVALHKRVERAIWLPRAARGTCLINHRPQLMNVLTTLATNNQPSQKECLSWLSHQLEVSKLDEWCNISETEFAANGGTAVLHYFGSLHDALVAVYPGNHKTPLDCSPLHCFATKQIHVLDNTDFFFMTIDDRSLLGHWKVCTPLQQLRHWTISLLVAVEIKFFQTRRLVFHLATTLKASLRWDAISNDNVDNTNTSINNIAFAFSKLTARSLPQSWSSASAAESLSQRKVGANAIQGVVSIGPKKDAISTVWKVAPTSVPRLRRSIRLPDLSFDQISWKQQRQQYRVSKWRTWKRRKQNQQRQWKRSRMPKTGTTCVRAGRFCTRYGDSSHPFDCYGHMLMLCV